MSRRNRSDHTPRTHTHTHTHTHNNKKPINISLLEDSEGKMGGEGACVAI